MQNDKTTRPNAHYAAGQVLLRFDADRGSSVFPPAEDGKPAAPVSETILKRLTNDGKFAFANEPESQFVVALEDNPQGEPAAMAQVTLAGSDPDRVAEYVGWMATRLSESDGRLEIGAEDGRTLWLTGAAPNWLGGAAGQTIGTGGPGTRPTRVARGNPATERFIFPQLEAHLAGEAKARRFGADAGPVDVFILDTLPGPRPAPGRARAALDPSLGVDPGVRAGLGEHPFGKLWLRPAHPGPLPTSMVTDDDGSSPLALTRVWAAPGALAPLVDVNGRSLYDIAGHDYDMSDHGLFIAGIIKRIAPAARIYLIEVLNQYGVGAATTIADGFRAVRDLRKLNQRTDTPCIINCSFTIAAPADDGVVTARRRRYETAHTAAGLEGALQGAANGRDTAALFESITAMARSERERCALVAAAGNDSDARVVRAARYPARLAGALGVGALDQRQRRARYSNFPDAPVNQGLMTTGTLRSLYSGLIPGDSAPRTGYAMWSGTSFATPVIAGALAMLVSEYGKSLSDAAAALRAAESGVEGVTGGEIVTAKQV